MPPSVYETYDFLLKFILIGESGTGKSCLLHHFIENKFRESSQHTIAVEFQHRIVNIGGQYQVKLQLWDTAGQERFRSVTRSYYRGAAGALLIYDVTNRKTFESLAKWLADARALASPDLVVVLVGNKNDCEEERQVSLQEGSRFAQENDLMFLETSAQTGDNVEECFFKAARNILTKIETGQLDPEKPGSGIQYGDSSSRRFSSAHRYSVSSSFSQLQPQAQASSSRTIAPTSTREGWRSNCCGS